MHSNIFDWVIGFAGNSTIPILTVHALSRLVSEAFIGDSKSFTEVLTRSVVSDHTLLKQNCVVAIFKENGETKKWGIAAHETPLRPWGLAVGHCGGSGCTGGPRSVQFMTKKDKVRAVCSKCQWRSRWLSKESLDFVHQWSKAHPLVYRHDFPLSVAQVATFCNSPADKD